MNPTTNRKAGLLYLLAVLVMLPFWYIILFVHNPPSLNPLDSFLYLLNEPPYRSHFWWLLVLPILCLSLAVAYFSRLAKARAGAFFLFGVGALLALASWLSVSAVAIFVSLPLFYAFVNCRQHLTNHSSGTR